MKKFISMVVLVVLFLCPFAVRADLGRLASEIYAENATIDSNIVMVISKSQAGTVSGTLTFDSNVLTLTDAQVVPRSRFNDLYSAINLTKTVNGGSAVISADNSGADYVIKITFKVKQAPSNGSTTVKFTPANNSWSGAVSSTIKIGKEKECPTCSKDEVTCPTCPTCETCKECEVCDTTNNEKEEKSSNNTALYVSLGTSALLMVAVIVLAVRKK